MDFVELWKVLEEMEQKRQVGLPLIHVRLSIDDLPLGRHLVASIDPEGTVTLWEERL